MKIFSMFRSRSKNEQYQNMYEIYYLKNDATYKCAIMADTVSGAIDKLQKQSPELQEQQIYTVRKL